MFMLRDLALPFSLSPLFRLLLFVAPRASLRVSAPTWKPELPLGAEA